MGLLSTLLGRPNTAKHLDLAKSNLTLGGIELPSDKENQHGLLVGATGTGKTTLLSEIIPAVIERKDRCIILDPNGHFLERTYRPSVGTDNDIVLNPFDRRGKGWSIFNEIQADYDYDRLARSIVPDGNGADASWYGYAQVLLAELLRMLLKQGDANTAALMYWASVAPVEKLRRALVDTAAAGLFDENAAKALASVRFILSVHLRPQKFLNEGNFSLRDWVHKGEGNLYLSWRSDMLSALSPLVSCWVDILLAEVLSLPPNINRRLWFFADELCALGKLSSLESALTLGRKHGLCVWVGLQSVSQLERLYGRDSAIVLRSCFRNLIVFAVAKTDPHTADVLSQSLGEREFDREQVSTSGGAQGISHSASVQRIKERLVLPSEISSLPDLTAYLAFSGDTPIRKIVLRPREYPIIAAAFVDH